MFGKNVCLLTRTLSTCFFSYTLWLCISSKTSNRCGTQFPGKRSSIAALSSHIDPIGGEAMSSMLGLCQVFVCIPFPTYAPVPPRAPRRTIVVASCRMGNCSVGVLVFWPIKRLYICRHLVCVFIVNRYHSIATSKQFHVIWYSLRWTCSLLQIWCVSRL